jgi:hypothetical protein
MGADYLQNVQKLANIAFDWREDSDVPYTQELIDKAFETWFKDNAESLIQNNDFESNLKNAFESGFKLVDGAWREQEGVGYSHYN